MSQETALYADVLVPLNLPGTFTYRVPPTLEKLSIGSRVLVPFGKKKFYTALVVMIHATAPQGYEVKEIIAMLDDYPIVRHPQIKFWNWIADYYLATPGEVYKAALPSGLKVESETYISVCPDYAEEAETPLGERERAVLAIASQHGRLQLSEIANATGYKNLVAIVNRLIDKGAVVVSERAVDTYTPKTMACATLTIDRNSDEEMHRLFDSVSRAKKQEALLLAYLDLSGWLQKSKPLKEVSKEALMKRADASQAVVSAAVQKGFLKIYKKEINRFEAVGEKRVDLPTLTEEQDRAYGEIVRLWDEKNVTLLHGVTSSGKTSIYMHLIADALKQGRQALYLVPEIALTTQLTQRLHRVFGNQLLIYHSKFSDNERVDIWKRLLTSGEPCVVIGVRSSVFLPYANLGLVIVDEEHDSSYKQQDPAPRYNGRDSAIALASMHGAKVLLGSATPAIETYYRAKEGKYGLVSLLTRYEGIEMPAMQIVNTKEERRKRRMKGTLSEPLTELCRSALNRDEQVILFQNRRGYAPVVQCRECGWVPRCESCDVSLTYHKHTNSLTCHYCGYTITLPTVCPACNLPGIQVQGYGTERIEDVVEEAFPNRKVLRMDLDTTRNKNSYDRIIEDFSAHKSDILVGTQMVTKGLDFGAVSVVGILNADTMLSFPDFRANERAFNMIEQVAGRAGRKGKQGLVVLQTSIPDHPVIGYAQAHDYLGFYEHELAERKDFHYPPFCKIINIHIKHRDEAVATELSVRYSTVLRQVFGERVLGPEAPFVARVQNFYLRQIMLKIEMQASVTKVKSLLRQIYEYMLSIDSRTKQAFIYYDVDPC